MLIKSHFIIATLFVLLRFIMLAVNQKIKSHLFLLFLLFFRGNWFPAYTEITVRRSIKSSISRRAPLLSSTIFVTPRKWSVVVWPPASQDSMARWIAVWKFSQRAKPSKDCRSRANQNSIPSDLRVAQQLSGCLAGFAAVYPCFNSFR